MSYDLGDFGISEMLRCGRGVRGAARDAQRMEAAADAIARYFYGEFRGAADRAHQLVMVRVYKTHPYDALEPEQRLFADRLLGGAPAAVASLRCLTLIASVGDEPAWCDRRRSHGHQAIPLASEEMVEQAPMIAQLFREFGIEIQEVVRVPALLTRSGKSFNVFHVEEARGSPYIPAQAEFVLRHGVRSVVGFGGVLRSGELFAVIAFSRVPVTAGAAGRFRQIALDVKYALFNYGDDEVFVDASAKAGETAAPRA